MKFTGITKVLDGTPRYNFRLGKDEIALMATILTETYKKIPKELGKFTEKSRIRTMRRELNKVLTALKKGEL